MADRRWLGVARKVKQVSTTTITAPVVSGELWTITVGNTDFTFEATAGTTSNVVDGLHALLSATDAPAVAQEMTWTKSDPDVIGTAKDAYSGVTITITETTDSAGGSIATVETTSATGPHHVDNVDNWSGGVVPVDTDNVYFGAAQNGPKYALSTLAAVTPTLVEISSLATYDFGLPRINADGGYTEYRQTDFDFDGATTFRILNDGGAGSALMRFDFQAAVVTAQIDKTATSSETGAPALNIIGTHADNAVEINNGSVGIAAFGGEVATVKTFTIAGGTLECGTGCTLDGAGSALTMSGGTATVRSNLLTVTLEGGTFTNEQSGTITTITVYANATWNWNSSGTVTTAVVHGTVDASADRSGRTVTTITVHPGASIDGVESITFTNGIAKAADVNQVVAS